MSGYTELVTLVEYDGAECHTTECLLFYLFLRLWHPVICIQ